MRYVLIFIGCLALCWQAPIVGQDVSPACFRSIPSTFYQQAMVVQALSLYRVDQSVWSPIYNALQAAVQQVPARMQAYAQAQNPNPLYPTFNPEAAVQVLEQALYEALFFVMQTYRNSYPNSINQNTIDGMFRYIWTQQYNSIQMCLNGVQ